MCLYFPHQQKERPENSEQKPSLHCLLATHHRFETERRQAAKAPEGDCRKAERPKAKCLPQLRT